MSDKVLNIKNLIDSSLAWIKSHKPEQYEQKFMQLVPRRCDLRSIEEASKENPAIAAYGESQKGKSYLMGNLLQTKIEGKYEQYKVKSCGQEYNFVHSINPIGDKNEATGVVTRFTAYNRNPELYSDEYPARMKVLSVGSLTTILIDGYFNDIIDREVYSDDDLKDKAQAIYVKYKDRQDVQNMLVEDDIYDIKSYLTKFITANAQSIWKSDFLDKVALVIRKVPQYEWIDIFSVIWHNNQEISSLYTRLIDTLSRLGYAKHIYLPIDAVLHRGDNKNTILSVNCLNGLYKVEDEILYTDVYIRRDSGNIVSFEKAGKFDKSEISALCCEVAFKVDTEFLDENAQYTFDPYKDGEPGYMSKRTYDKLNKSVSKKALFANSDLLDFPGAKNREALKQSHLANFDSETQQANMVKLFLRGKVAYLFNYYSEAKLINILLICHDAEDVKVTTLYNTVDKWVTTYVGENPEERKATLSLTEGISPLFVVGTKFNIDMTQKSNAEGNNRAALEQRWQARFSTQLYQNCFHAGDVEWFRNWTGEKQMFNNTYVLRDYKYSTCDGEGNHLFRGYNETKQETSLALSAEYYKTLKDSFVENDKHVGRFFEDRTLAWEVAATINNDGALYIIQQLLKVSKKLNELRDKQFSDTIESISLGLLKVMKSYYIDPKVSSVLPQRISKARSAHRELDFACNADNYFFGSLINALQIEYKEVYNVIHETIHSPELVKDVNGWDQFEIIRKHLISCETEEDSWNKLISVYGFADKAEAVSFLNRKKINPQDIIPGVKLKKKLNSYVIADKVFKYWSDKLSSTAFLSNVITDDEFDSGVMIDLIRNTLEVAEGFNICEIMSSKIAEYVNVPAVHLANEFLVTDMLANIINEFITKFGYDYREQADKDNCRVIAEKYDLPVYNYLETERKDDYSEEELTSMFIELNDNQNALTNAFDMSYNLWLEYMYISFIGGADRVPKIDNVAANNAVADIINQIAAL